MRTTITIDDDVASSLRPLLAKGKHKEVLNDLLRRALGIQKAREILIPSFDLGLKPGIDPVSFNRLAEEEAFESDSKRFVQ